MRNISIKTRIKALVDFGKQEIFRKKEKWRELSVQEFHTQNAFQEEHLSLRHLFSKKNIKFQASMLRSKKIPGGSELQFIPYGVFGTVTPSNTSYAMLTAILQGAILSGNACVVKPPKDSPLVACEMVNVFENFLVEKYGFPKGVFNLIIG